MDSQDTATDFLFKIWPAIEANRNRVIGGAIAAVLLVFIIIFVVWQRDQKEINAGQAFSQMEVSLQPNTSPSQLADQYLKIATDYPGTLAAQRAQLQGAAALFNAGRYADAQAQFQKFLDAAPSSTLVSIGALGIATSEDAQNNPAAADAYKNVIETYAGTASAVSAQYALAGIYERQGNLKDAIRYYEEIARTAAGSSLGQQAGQRSVELSAALAAKTPATAATTAAPVATPSGAFQLSK